MLSCKRSPSDTRAQSEVQETVSTSLVQCKCAAEAHTEHDLQHSTDDRGRRTLPDAYNGSPLRGGMAPPPTPIDPALDSWKASSTTLSPGLDPLPSSPGPSSRASLSGLSNLDSLAREIQLPAMKQNPAEPDPLLRFWNEPGPWNSQRIGGGSSQTSMVPQYAGYNHQMPRPVKPMHYGYGSPRSDVGSSTTGRYFVDSGYEGSRSMATKSVRSADNVDQGQPCPSISGEVHDLHLYSRDSYPDHPAPSAVSPNSQYHPMDPLSDDTHQATVTFDLTCPYANCGATSKNHSEHRKHMLRHEKPYKCDVPGCSKVDGFSTNNDLDRHKKSVHKIMPKNSTDRSFRCAAINCPKKEKIWPRLDNFRQHCLRIHQEEDCDDLVRKSELEPGVSLQANDLANGSNHDAGDISHGDNVGELADYINPSITFDHPLNMMPFQSCTSPASVDHRIQHAPSVRSVSPHSPETASFVNHYVPYQQNIHASQLLQIPGPKSPRKRLLSPSDATFPEQSNIKAPSTVGMTNKKPTRSKAIASNKKAEEVSEELALEITKCINLGNNPSEDIQAVIKKKVLLALNPGLSRKRSAQMAMLDHESRQSKKKRIKCGQCSVTTARECDMKKHRKRHTRPYGCTFPGCMKKLGSKNDWKRHENTQHYQIETWRCHEYSKDSKIHQCADIFYRREQFQAHLRDKHQIQDEEHIRDQCKRHRIGRNGQSGFWCGFCKKIVELKSKGLEAWEERFSHIDDLHYKKGQTIYDWVPLDSDLPKGLMSKGDLVATGSQDSPDDDRDDGSSEDDSEDGPSQGSTPNDSSPKPPQEELHLGAVECTGWQSARREKVFHCVSRPR
ncbi:MAG: hypothetical protein Q9222_006681 [Ikaeria aurantiellina]